MVALILSIYGIVSVSAFMRKADTKHLYVVLGLFYLFIILVMAATFRPSDMSDYQNYEYIFRTGENERMEPGFMGLVHFLGSFVSEPRFFFACFAILSIGIRLKAIQKLSPSISLSLLIYLSNVFVLHDMIQIRCAIASSLALFAFKYIYERKVKQFVLTCGLALLFHYSAALILPLWFFNVHKPQKIFFLSLIPASYVLAITGNLVGSYVQYVPIEAVQEMWEIYNYSTQNGLDEGVNIFNILHLFRCAICMFLCYNIDYISKYNEFAILLVKIYVASLVSFILFSDISAFAFRISEFLQVVEILLLPMLVYKFKQRFIGKLVVVMIGFVFLGLTIMYHLK